jgi:4-hydroxybutyrate dehydrogenase
MAVMQYLTDCRFDHGVRSQLGACLKRLGASGPLVVTDPGIAAIGLLDTALEGLGAPPAAVFKDTPANPTEQSVLAGLAAYRDSGADSLVAVGGGSAMDLAKAVGLLATHEGPLARLGTAQKGTRHIGAIPPLVALPTTSGTGSEVSIGAMIVMDTGQKELFVSSQLIPKVALCDPELTLGLPPGLTAATGMDAVTHCIESLMAPAVHPPADAIALDGIERALRQGMLARAVADGADRDARWHMMMASTEGAMAFVKGLGSVHALAHAAGAIKALNLHHGTLNAIFLPHVMRINRGAAPDKEDRLRAVLGLPAGACLGDAIQAVNDAIGIPPNLSALGVSEAAHGAAIVAGALADLAHFTNPRPLAQGDYEALVVAALG